MTTEIETIIRGFRASVIGEIQNHRVMTGAGAVPAFDVAVRRHKQRVLSKLEDTRARFAGDALESAATSINDQAEAVLARVKAAGQVEFADGPL
jgi:hypothetical protein